MAIHAGLSPPARLRTSVGHRHALRPASQLAVPAAAALSAEERAVRRRLQRGQTARRQRNPTPHERTPDQTEIGLFWLESSPLAWNRLARAVSVARGFDAWENARLFALLNLAMADGYIASWEAKYHYRFWRPITAIRLGDTDGNPRTEGDAGLDAAAVHVSDAGSRLRACRARRRGGGDLEAGVRDRRRRVHGVQYDAAGWQQLRGSRTGASVVHQFFPGRRRERRVAHLHRHSLPKGG